jgi:hypothetical protein
MDHANKDYGLIHDSFNLNNLKNENLVSIITFGRFKFFTLKENTSRWNSIHHKVWD